MHNYKLGILGGGNMAEAFLRGALDSGTLKPDQIMISDVAQERLGFLRTTYHINTTSSNAELARWADIILLAVKPFVCKTALREAGEALANKAIVSIIAGWTHEALQNQLPAGVRILRVMPNTPAMIGQGALVLEAESDLFDEEMNFVRGVLKGCGELFVLSEEVFDAVTGLSGSGPAFVFHFIDALANGGLLQGIPKAVAIRLAIQTVVGAGAMLKATKKTPSELRDMVMTPGGTAVEGLRTLEAGGFSGIVMDTVRAAAEKSANLNK